MQRLNLTGQRFGRLLVRKRLSNIGKRSRWKCSCDCGKIISVLTESLRGGNTKSCGCYRTDTLKLINLKHGFNRRDNRRREYGIWSKMKGRCLLSTDRAYPKYGGRGITVCKKWLTFEAFIADMGSCPDGLTLERIDNDKGYEPNNCKWGTRTEQARNRRSTKLTPILVRFIRANTDTPKILSPKIGISASLISHVRRNTIWKDI